MHSEEHKKLEGMDTALGKNTKVLKYAREIAEKIGQAKPDGLVSADDVRCALEKMQVDLGSGNWWGSLFRYGWWKATGLRVKCKHDGGHAREVRLWAYIGPKADGTNTLPESGGER